MALPVSEALLRDGLCEACAAITARDLTELGAASIADHLRNLFVCDLLWVRCI